MKYKIITIDGSQYELLTSKDLKLMEAGMLCLAYNFSHQTRGDIQLATTSNEYVLNSQELNNVLNEVGIAVKVPDSDPRSVEPVQDTLIIEDTEYSVVHFQTEVLYSAGLYSLMLRLSFGDDNISLPDDQDHPKYFNDKKTRLIVKRIEDDQVTFYSAQEVIQNETENKTSFYRTNNIKVLAAIIDNESGNTSLLNLHLGSKYPHQQTEESVSFIDQVLKALFTDELTLDSDYLTHNKSGRILGRYRNANDLRPTPIIDSDGRTKIGGILL